MKVNKIWNEDCFNTMERISDEGKKVQLILTSPPYNTGRPSTSSKGRDNHEARYDLYLDGMSDKEYMDWTVKLFNKYDSILRENGVVLYNMSYSTDMNNRSDSYKPNEIMFKTINAILTHTQFTIADVITWKKQTALPNNTSPNKLTRIVEYVYVFCRDSELATYHANKTIKSVSKKGQNFYENMFNFIEAKNNDGSNKLNKATFSSEFATKLLDMYARDKGAVYDSFMGTGTTAVACINKGLKYIGSELSEEQCKYARKRIKAHREALKTS